LVLTAGAHIPAVGSAPGGEAATGSWCKRATRFRFTGAGLPPRISVVYVREDSGMHPDRWNQISLVIHAALARPARDRAAFLRE